RILSRPGALFRGPACPLPMVWRRARHDQNPAYAPERGGKTRPWASERAEPHRPGGEFTPAGRPGQTKKPSGRPAPPAYEHGQKGAGTVADPKHACQYNPMTIARYPGRISGP